MTEHSSTSRLLALWYISTSSANNAGGGAGARAGCCPAALLLAWPASLPDCAVGQLAGLGAADPLGLPGRPPAVASSPATALPCTGAAAGLLAFACCKRHECGRAQQNKSSESEQRPVNTIAKSASTCSLDGSTTCSGEYVLLTTVSGYSMGLHPAHLNECLDVQLVAGAAQVGIHTLTRCRTREQAATHAVV